MSLFHVVNATDEKQSSVACPFATIDETSSEFGAVVADIAEELDKCNVNKIKLVCTLRPMTTCQY